MGNFIKKNKPNEDEDFLVISYNEVQCSFNTKTLDSVEDCLSCSDEKIRCLIEKWKAEQRLLQEKLNLHDPPGILKNIQYIGGVDLSFPKTNKSDMVHACACLVVLTYPQLKVVYTQCEMTHLTSIYIPHYLAFREVEPIKSLCSKLLAEKPEYFPQVLLVDGNGLLHPRKFGLACHLGVVLDMPTIGVAKKLLHIDGIQKDDYFKQKCRSLLHKGDSFDIIGKDSVLYGSVLRSTNQSTNPIYVSVGNYMLIDTAIEIVNMCCLYRIPEPIRLADQLSREHLRDHYVKHVENCKDYLELNDYFNDLTKLSKGY